MASNVSITSTTVSSTSNASTSTSSISQPGTTTTTASTSILNLHNLLKGLQGGTTDQYYHLTSAQHGTLTDGSNADALHTHSASTVAHSATTGLQGGTTDEYYHLTETEHTELSNWLDGVVLDTDGNISLSDNIKLFLGDNKDASIFFDIDTGLNINLDNPSDIGPRINLNDDVNVGGELKAELGIWLDDNEKFYFGDNKDTEVYCDGSDLIIDPKAVTSTAGVRFASASTGISDTDNYILIGSELSGTTGGTALKWNYVVKTDAPTNQTNFGIGGTFSMDQEADTITGRNIGISNNFVVGREVGFSGTSSDQEVGCYEARIAVNDTGFTGVVNYLSGMACWLTTDNDPSGTITALQGLYLYGFDATHTNMTITTAYGLRIEDVTTATDNYSIYTQLGEVSFGDDVILRNSNDYLYFGTNKDASIHFDIDTGLNINLDNPSDIGPRIKLNDDVDISGELNVDLGVTSAGVTSAGNVVIDDSSFQMNLESAAKVHLNNDGNSYFNGGNVGINETDPDAPLHVSMDGFSAGTIGSDTAIVVSRVASGASAVEMSLIGGTSSQTKINFGDDGTEYQGAVAYNTSTDTISLHTDGASRMTVGPKGEVTMASETDLAAALLILDQNDADQPFTHYQGTTAGDGSASASTDTTEDSAKYGALRIQINGLTKWIRIYDDHS
tara:strand:- start:8024 stop:10045 length:2022 start_codon:yes stop_codon:yes gene_type:complete